jgi:hypothetical protein
MDITTHTTRPLSELDYYSDDHLAICEIPQLVDYIEDLRNDTAMLDDEKEELKKNIAKLTETLGDVLRSEGCPQTVIANDKLKHEHDELKKNIKNYETNEKIRELLIADQSIEIKALKEENEKLKNPEVPLHKKPIHDIFMKFIAEECEEIDNIGVVAPTMFEDIYYEFRGWIDKQDLAGRVKGCNKKLIKSFMIEAQEQSKYGLDLGKVLADKRKNGTALKLRVNFVCKNKD